MRVLNAIDEPARRNPVCCASVLCSRKRRKALEELGGIHGAESSRSKPTRRWGPPAACRAPWSIWGGSQPAWPPPTGPSPGSVLISAPATQRRAVRSGPPRSCLREGRGSGAELTSVPQFRSGSSRAPDAERRGSDRETKRRVAGARQGRKAASATRRGTSHPGGKRRSTWHNPPAAQRWSRMDAAATRFGASDRPPGRGAADGAEVEPQVAFCGTAEVRGRSAVRAGPRSP